MFNVPEMRLECVEVLLCMKRLELSRVKDFNQKYEVKC